MSVRKKKIIFVAALLLFAVSVLSACVKGAPLNNGDFEKVSTADSGAVILESWDLKDEYKDKIKVDNTARENYSVVFTHTSYTYSYISQKVSVSKNAYYKLSYELYIKEDISAEGSSQSSVGAYVGFLEDSKIYQNQVAKTDGKWLNVDVYLNTKGYSELNLALRLGNENVPVRATEVRFDNIKLEKISRADVPENVLSSNLLFTVSKNQSEYSTPFSVFVAVFACVLTAAVCAALYYLIRKGLKARDLNGGEPVKSRLSSTKLLIILMLSAFAVRALIQQIVGGYEETTGPLFFSGLVNSLSTSFSNWASILNTNAGRAQTHGMLYLYSVIGGLCRLFGIESGDAGIDLMTKIPGVIADILAVGFLFIFIRRYIGDKSAFWCSLAYALLPPVFMASAGWGTADSVMGLFLLLAFFSILDKKYVLTCVYTSLAVFFNIKALYVLPLITAFLVYIFVRKVELRSKLAITAGACIVAFWLLSFPFINLSDNVFYIFIQYTRLSKVTIGSGALLPLVDRSTLDAFNFYGMIGGNYRQYSDIQAYLDMVIAIALFIAAVVLYFKRKNSADLILIGAFLITAIYMFTLGMRPYAMIFALVLMLLYAVVAGEKRAFFFFSAYAFTTVLNIVYVMSSDGTIGGDIAHRTAAAASLLSPVLVILFSVVNVLLTFWFAYLVYDITYRGRMRSILPAGDDSGDGVIIAWIKSVFKGGAGKKAAEPK